MKFSTSVLAFVWLSQASGQESQCNQANTQSTCIQAVDENQLPCEWCVAGAIPSECMSADQAKQLPDGVFDCSSPGSHRSSFFGASNYSFRTSTPEPEASDICDSSSKSLSGYMDVKGSRYDANGENKHLFFWMFEKRGEIQESDDDTPFVVWFTGGPGCSSTLALLSENGPCSVKTDASGTSNNPYSWTESAHVLWLDQPAGVGFSYGEETDKNEEMVAEDVYYFLQAFFQTYPQYQKNPLFFVGESYGGHYAPAVAHHVWESNKKLHPDTIKLNLSGVAVGNGLTDPEHQYPAYVDMAKSNSHDIAFLDDATISAMEAVVPRCTDLIHQCNKGDSTLNNFACQAAFLLCNAGLTSPYQMTGLNPYDIRKKCEVPPLCYDFSFVQEWLNKKDVRKALNVDEAHSHAWGSCNFGINGKFHTDWMKSFSGFIADMLNDGIPILIYAGDVDYICNYLGNRAWTLALDWSDADSFVAAEDHDWQGAGLARTAGGFTFLQVYDAGHMVPSDQPEVALDMITNFVKGGSF